MRMGLWQKKQRRELWRRKRADMRVNCQVRKDMLVEPSSSSPRGQAVLQPAYFTADIFISPLRRDLDALIDAYRNVYPSSSPFALFKHTWLSHKWHWLIFKVFDSRSRHSFLSVTLRLFLGWSILFSLYHVRSLCCIPEKTVDTESLFTRVAALFAFYTFFYSQPLDTAPPLYSISHIPIAIGTPFFSFSPMSG